MGKASRFEQSAKIEVPGPGKYDIPGFTKLAELRRNRMSGTNKREIMKVEDIEEENPENDFYIEENENVYQD